MKIFNKDSERRNEKVIASFSGKELLLILLVNAACILGILLTIGYCASR
jgi:hypothetical protein